MNFLRAVVWASWVSDGGFSIVVLCIPIVHPVSSIANHVIETKWGRWKLTDWGYKGFFVLKNVFPVV